VHIVDGRDEPFFGDAIYNTYRENTRAFEDFGVWTPYANVATVTGRSEPEEVVECFSATTCTSRRRDT
jgi:hypothetical protein